MRTARWRVSSPSHGVSGRWRRGAPPAALAAVQRQGGPAECDTLGALVVVAALVVPASASAQVGNVITRGVAVDASGRPTAATVTGFVLPDDGPKMLQQVAQAQAGPDGAFTLTAADPGALNGMAQAGDGSVDVLVQVDAAGGTATTMTQWVTAAPIDAAPLAFAATGSPPTLAAVDPYPRRPSGARATQVKCRDGSVFGRPAKKVLSAPRIFSGAS